MLICYSAQVLDSVAPRARAALVLRWIRGSLNKVGDVMCCTITW